MTLEEAYQIYDKKRKFLNLRYPSFEGCVWKQFENGWVRKHTDGHHFLFVHEDGTVKVIKE